jgi:hypothetical protein
VSAARQRLSWATSPAGTADADDSAMEWLSADLVGRIGTAHQARCDAEAEAEAGAGLCFHDPEKAEELFFPEPKPCTWEVTCNHVGHVTCGCFIRLYILYHHVRGDCCHCPTEQHRLEGLLRRGDGEG